MFGKRQRGKSIRISWKLLLNLFILVLAPWLATHAAAQGEGQLILSGFDIQQFPLTQFNLDVYDGEGNSAQELTRTDIQIVEDGEALQPERVEILRNGLQVIIALNTAPVLANQTDGRSEYQRIQSTLKDWAGEQDDEKRDDFSLATPTGLFLIRSQKAAQLVKALDDYQPDLPKSKPSLNSLAEALDLATDPLSSPMMKRSILYITPLLEGSNSAPMADLTNRARELGVRVHVWLLIPANQSVPIMEGEASPQELLQDLARATGGTFAQITPVDPLPDIEPMFEPQRKSYQVLYNSSIRKSGQHQVTVKVNSGSLLLSSEPHRFDVDVQPPNPIFLSPPTTVERSWSAPEQNLKTKLVPEEVSLQILVEFPDQHKRDLQATRLFLDGRMVDENSAQPFEAFTLPLSDLDTTTSHLLRVEAVDLLGLTGSSMEIPVDVVVSQPAKASLFDQLSERGMIAIAAMTAAGAGLALVLGLTGSRRWVRKKKQQVDKKRAKDPVTQPVPIRQEQARKQNEKKAGAAHPTWPPAIWHSASWPRAHTQSAPARLVILDENEQPVTGGVLPLLRQEITFGSDPKRATQVLDSPTVDGLHARLYRTEEGTFFLADQNSVAGTWINYAPITSAGSALEHGDLIHVGKMLFRFELTDPSKITTAEIKVDHLDKRR